MEQTDALDQDKCAVLEARAATGSDSLVQLGPGEDELKGLLLSKMTLLEKLCENRNACLSVRGVMTRRPELPRYSYPYRASALIMRTIKVSCSSVASQTLIFMLQCYLARAAMETNP